MENIAKKRIYKTKFDNKELSALNTIENELVRSRVMSTYAYLKKLITSNEGSYCVYSKQLEKNYNRKHEPTTYRTLLTRINILIGLGLIKKTVKFDGCIYELGVGIEAKNKKEKLYTDEDLEFSELVKNILNTIENEKIRSSAKSIYRYFKILIIEGKGSTTISFQKFLKRYSFYDKKYNRKSNKIMTPQTFKTRVDLLIELGLIKRTEYKKTFTYELTLEVPPCLIDNNYNNNNDNNNPPPGNDNEEIITLTDSYFGRFINSANDEPESKPTTPTTNFGEFISSPDEAVEYVKRVAKELNIRSKWVINSAIANIKSCYSKINKRGAFNYIGKTILKLQAISKQVYKNTKVYCDSIKKYRETNNPKKRLSFNNFTQRDYDEEKMERLLLGDDSITLDDCYLGMSNPYDKDSFVSKDKLNNFKQEDYDYDDDFDYEKLDRDMMEKQNKEIEECLNSKYQERYNEVYNYEKETERLLGYCY